MCATWINIYHLGDLAITRESYIACYDYKFICFAKPIINLLIAILAKVAGVIAVNAKFRPGSIYTPFVYIREQFYGVSRVRNRKKVVLCPIFSVPPRVVTPYFSKRAEKNMVGYKNENPREFLSKKRRFS